MSSSPCCKRDIPFRTVTEERSDRRDWGNSSKCSTYSQSTDVISPLSSSTCVIINSDNDEGCTTPTNQRRSVYTASLHSNNSLSLSSMLKQGRKEGLLKTSTSERVQTRPPTRRGQRVHTPKTVDKTKYQHQCPPASTSPSGQSGSLGYEALRVPSTSSLDLQSVMTTCSELDFRKDLASLDTDIARLQAQFKVALQSPI